MPHLSSWPKPGAVCGGCGKKMNSQDFNEGAISREIMGNGDAVSLASTSPTPVLDDSSSELEGHGSTASQLPNNPSPGRSNLLRRLDPFWHDRLLEAGLIVSMALYYITGNQHLGT